MKVDRYIEELLFDHECVIIPGLGGFIVNERNASIDGVTHQFNPPFNKILFNQHIRFNDGLLVNYIANKNGLSFEAVRKQIDEQVHLCFAGLEKGEKIIFENIGVLSFDKNKNITFDQNTSFNYNAESFGLGSFVSPPVRRKTEAEPVKGIIQPQPVLPKREDRRPKRENAEDLKPIHKRRSHSKYANVRTFVLISLTTVLFTVITFATFNTEVTGNYWQKLTSALTIKSVKSHYVPRSDQNIERNNMITNQAGFLSGTTFEVESPIVKNISNDMAENIQAEEKYLSGEISVEDYINYRGRNLAENSNETIDETEFEESENILVKELAAEEPLPPVAKEEIVVHVKPASQYYIIAGSFSEESNAKKLIDNLLKKGFSAQIIDTNKNGMYRVAYFGIENFTEAKQKLYAIRNEDNPEAWILKK